MLGDNINVNGDDAKIFKALYPIAPPKKDQDIESAGSKGAGNGEISLYWLFAYQNPPIPATGNPGRGKADLIINEKYVEVKAYDSKSMTFGRIGSDKENIELLNTLFGLNSLLSSIDPTASKDKQASSLRFSKKDITQAFKTFNIINNNEDLRKLSKDYSLIALIYKKVDDLITKIKDKLPNTDIDDAEDAAGASTVASVNTTDSYFADQDTFYGTATHAEGSVTKAIANYSHAEGGSTKTLGLYSHAEGLSSKTIGSYSHAEGIATVTYGEASHAEGDQTITVGRLSHAEGKDTIASGNYSHAEGEGTVAIGEGSSTKGYYTIASGAYQTVVGQYNVAYESQSAFIIGDGATSVARHNLLFASKSWFEVSASSLFFQGLQEYSPGWILTYNSESGRVYYTSSIDSQPAPSDTYIQYNSGSKFGAEQYFRYIYTSHSFQHGNSTYAIGQYSHTEGGQTYTGTLTGYSASIVSGIVTLDASYGDVTTEFNTGDYLWFTDDDFPNIILIDFVTYSSPNTVITLNDLSFNYSSAVVGNASIHPSNWTGDQKMGASAAHAEGESSYAINVGSHAEGKSTTAIGQYSHAEGKETTALGDYSHAEGSGSYAVGVGSHAKGYLNSAIGNYSHAEGTYTTSSGVFSHTEGSGSVSTGHSSHAEGLATQAFGTGSHTEGQETTTGEKSHAEGYKAIAGWYGFPAEGISSGEITLHSAQSLLPAFQLAGGTLVIVGGDGNRYLFDYDSIGSVFSIALGVQVTTIQLQETDSILETVGVSTVADITKLFHPLASVADGQGSHAEGSETFALGDYSHAEGGGYLKYFTTALGDFSHAEGIGTVARGSGSHAEGRLAQAVGSNSHAEGHAAIAIGEYSHAEGFASYAIGTASHAEGRNTDAFGDYSHTAGHLTIASGSYQFVVGQLNATSSGEAAFIIGDGYVVEAAPDVRHNLLFASTSWFEVSASHVFFQGIPDTQMQHVLTINPVDGRIYYTGSNSLSAVSTPLDVSDETEGNVIVSSPTFLNFTGSGVDVTANGAGVDIYIPGGGGSGNSLSTPIGNGLSSSFDIAHGFGTRDVHVTVYGNGGNYETVYADVRRPDVNTVRVVFATIPTTNQFVVYISQ